MRKLVKKEKICLFTDTMPRTQSDDHGVGYIRGRMDQLADILHRLGMENYTFRRSEVIKILEEVHRTRLAIQSNVYVTQNEEARQILTSYVAMARSIYDRAAELLDTLGGSAGIDLPPRPSIEALELRKKPKQKKKKKKKSNAIDWSKFTFGDEDDEEKDEYATDNEQPMSLQAMSAVYSAPDAEAVPAEDLRARINRSQQIRAENTGRRGRDDDEDDWNRPSTSRAPNRYMPVRNEPDQAGPSQRQQASARVRDGWDQAGPSHESQRAAQPRSTVSVVSGRSSMSTSSYVSQPQEQAYGRQLGVLYPPMARESPVPINRKDKSIIGKAEYYTTVIEHHRKCPLCRGKHKVYRCTMFLRAGLQERWYLILKHGLCLNCLYPKHSSFTCRQDGTCTRCGQRHNSLLCPRHPEWRDGDRDRA